MSKIIMEGVKEYAEKTGDKSLCQEYKKNIDKAVEYIEKKKN